MNKRKWKIIAFAAVLLWMAAGVSLIYEYTQKDEGIIVEAFQKSEFVDADCKVEAAGTYGGAYLSVESQESLVKRIAKNLGIQGKYNIKTELQENKRTVTLSKAAEHATTKIQLVSVEEEGENKVINTYQYVTTELGLYGNIESAIGYKSKLEKIYDAQYIKGKAYVTLNGTYEGMLNKKEKDAVVSKILDTMDAKKISEYKGEDMYNIYAYTRHIPEYEMSSGKKMNVNIAVTYDEEAKKTKLYLATPIVQEDI